MIITQLETTEDDNALTLPNSTLLLDIGSHPLPLLLPIRVGQSYMSRRISLTRTSLDSNSKYY
jgi:hypothetical protein